MKYKKISENIDEIEAVNIIDPDIENAMIGEDYIVMLNEDGTIMLNEF